MWVSRMLPWRHDASTRWTRSLPMLGAAPSRSRRFPLFWAFHQRSRNKSRAAHVLQIERSRRREKVHERSSEHLHRSRRTGWHGRSLRRSAGGSWTWRRDASTHCSSLDRGSGTPAPSRRDGLELGPAGRRQRPPRQRLAPGVRARAYRAVCDTLPRVSSTSGLDQRGSHFAFRPGTGDRGVR